MPFDLGDTVRLEAECRDAAGSLATASTAVLTITLPDGTTATPTVPAPAQPGQPGQYRVDYVTTQAGRHSARWVWTGPECAYTDMFDVREAVPPQLFSLADAKRHLQITTSTSDDELRAVGEATTRAVEFFVGAVTRRTVTEVAHGGTDRMLLTTTPVLSVTSVAGIELGQLAVPAAAVDVDTDTGVLRRTDGMPFWAGPYRVVYVAGRTLVPANIALAGKLILQHLWRTQYGASRGLSAIGGGEDFNVTEPIPGLGYAIPNRALQLLQADRQPGGIA
ncbi:hypothetical protein ABZ312_11405 [Streptomyces sp. NPDC006207]